MTHLLAVDPGIRYPAAALFVDGQLVAASRVKLKTAWSKLPIATRCLTVAREIRDWYAGHLTESVIEMVYAFEWPKKYAGAKSKGDPADLFPLTGVGMALAGLMYDRVHSFEVVSYLPREWAGTTSKSTTGDPLASPRGQRIWSRLSDVERASVVLSHDSVDAVGIGLHHLGRLERVRSFLGAT